MPVSFFDSEKKYLRLNYRFKKLGDGFLVTNDFGSWVFLDKEEFDKFKKDNLDSDFFNFLKDKGFIIDRENVDEIVDSYKKKFNYLSLGTNRHIIVLTLRCNHNCSYCHACSKSVNEKEFDMDYDTARKTIEFILQSKAKDIIIEFQGGEPLLNFDVLRFIVNYSKELNKKYEKNLSFELVSNLSLIDDIILEFLIQNNVSISTSLDGIKEVHNKHRDNSYDSTINGIKKIQSKYGLNAMLLIGKSSLGHEKEIVDEYIKNNLGLIWAKPINRLGRALENWDKIGVSDEEFFNFWKNSLEYIVELNKKGKNIKEYGTIILLNKILTKQGFNFTELQSPCGAIFGQLLYNYNGKIYSCDEGKLFDIFNIGTVDEKYEDLIKKDDCSALVESTLNDNHSLCQKCAYKPYCGICVVCNYQETNDLRGNLPDFRCKIFMRQFDYMFDKIINDKEFRDVVMRWI